MTSSAEKVLTLVLAAAVVLQAMLPSTVAQPLPRPGPGSRVVELTSKLDVPMDVRCKGDNHEYPPRLIFPGKTYKFIIPQSSSTALYSCRFVIYKVIHTFDIYNADRDGPCPVDGDHFRCDWSVKESGPCLEYYDHNCYPWNQI